MENCKRRPLELPKPQPATYQEVKPRGEVASSTESEPEEQSPETGYAPPRPLNESCLLPMQDLQPAPHTTPVEALQTNLISVPADRTTPTIRNLVRVGHKFIRPDLVLSCEDRLGVLVSSPTATLMDPSDDQTSQEPDQRSRNGQHLTSDIKAVQTRHEQEAMMRRMWIWMAMTVHVLLQMTGIWHRPPRHKSAN